MARAHFAYIARLLICQLLLIINSNVLATPLTYAACMSSSASYSYKVGGWCFYLYRDPSWANKYPGQDIAQTMCLPYGSLAVGVTYNMLDTFRVSTMITPTGFIWTALVRNTSYASQTQGWSWSSLMPNGGYATFPAIMANIPWGPGNPDNQFGNGENSAGLFTPSGFGMDDLQKNIIGNYLPTITIGILCQFAPQQWSYTKRGNGRFANSAYQISRSTTNQLDCIRSCHHSVFCVSLAFNPTTNDCQTYAVSPEDPIFAGGITADSTYDWHIRDGMRYF